MADDIVIWMRKGLAALVVLLSIISFFLMGCVKEKETGPLSKVRMPAAIGFYPGDRGTLKSTLVDLFSKAEPGKINGDLVALIVPHAGYQYSGMVAAQAYSVLKKGQFNSVVVVSPSHYVSFDGAAFGEEDAYRTPLGDVKIDSEILSELSAIDKRISAYPSATLKEHSVEVQLPFLQEALGDFNLVPIVMGNPSKENCQMLAMALASIVKRHPGTLLVASSDMSHYYPYEVANKMDSVALKSITRMDYENLAKDMNGRKCELCGAGPVLAVLEAAKILGANKAKLLKYANSGDTAGDKSRVVGYSAVALSRLEVEGNKDGGTVLSVDEHKRLLDLARQSISKYLETGKEVSLTKLNSRETRKCGAFVTLSENGQLRGCIGFTEPIFPLWQTISRAAVAAATQDPRFPPLSKDELSEIKIEISVLTPPVKVKDIDEIRVGTHGLVVKKGGYSGLLLPQVATEYGWNRLQFLDQTCRKAGLMPGEWKNGAEIYRFSAEVFNEKGPE